MTADIYFIISFDVAPERFDQIVQIVNTLSSISKDEDGCLAYECSITSDHTTIHMIEHFSSSSSLHDHITGGFANHAPAWSELVSLSSFVVVGNPSAEVRKLLPSIAVYCDRIGGFTK